MIATDALGGVQVVPLLLDERQGAERERHLRTPLPASHLRELDGVPRDPRRTAETAANELDPRQSADARELCVRDLGQARHLERLGEAVLRVDQPVERELRETQMSQRDGTHRVRG
jgi:hypothetical protein